MGLDAELATDSSLALHCPAKCKAAGSLALPSIGPLVALPCLALRTVSRFWPCIALIVDTNLLLSRSCLAMCVTTLQKPRLALPADPNRRINNKAVRITVKVYFDRAFHCTSFLVRVKFSLLLDQ